MTITEIVADVVGALLVATQFIAALKSIWAKLPKPVAVLAPVLVSLLPQVAAAFGLVTTEQGLVQTIVTSLVLLVPAIIAAETGSTPTAQ